MTHIAYYRVSTVSQGKSGLGLEAQRAAVVAFMGEPAQEFVEVESGRRTTRPKLMEAIEAARSTKSVLVVAKLDRLARNARFLLEITDSGIDVAFCDLPDLPAGPMGRFFLTMMAAVAELESGMISERTKAALKAAKVRGTKLGTAGIQRAVENKKRASAFSRSIEPHIKEAQMLGCRSNLDIVDYLNNYGPPAHGGGKWHQTTVRRLLARLET